jgi:hypothetical protein
VPLSPRNAASCAGFLAALAVAAGGLLSGGAVDGGSAASAAPASASPVADGGPRNLEAEAASGDVGRMIAVVRETVDCLRTNGYRPGDPQVEGQSVVIAGWNPPLDSPTGRATEACSFPDR